MKQKNEIMKRAMLNVGGAIGMALLTLALLLSLLGVASARPLADNSWPGQRDLWAGSPVTQTVQYQSLDVVGANYRHVFYETGVGTVTGTMTITVDSRWNGNTFATQTETAGVGPYAASVTGVITEAVAPLYCPSLRVGVFVDGGTITPTISVVGQ
jgi:hypothetical protein